MIISWFTQPPRNGFSSYYQYDTITKHFSRIRLELGRNSKSGLTDDTLIAYFDKRSVGFSNQKFTDKSLFSVNDDGALCYDGTALADEPQANYRVYDTSTLPSVHSGNPITRGPTLPEGIAGKHLALLANDAFITKTRRVTLTNSEVSETDLVKAIKDKVCEILEVEEFTDATDDVILAKLKSQIKTIGEKAADEYESILDKAVAEVQRTNELIENGLTPNDELDTAFESLRSAFSKYEAAKDIGAVREAVTAISEAQQTVTAAVEKISSTEKASVAEQLKQAQESLSTAEQNATEWQSMEESCEKLADVEGIDDYEREIGIETEEVV